MDLASDTASRYLRHALDQLVAVAARLGDERVNLRPHGEATNSVAALTLHCCGVAEFWLGHVGLGRESSRDREAEFSSTATVAELRAAVADTLGQVDRDLADLAAGGASPRHAASRQHLLDGDGSDASLVLHVVEELFQHLGHAELTADALLGS